MENSNLNTNNKRKPFPKPKITKVRLAAEEAVLATCKVGGIQDACQAITCGVGPSGTS